MQTTTPESTWLSLSRAVILSAICLQLSACAVVSVAGTVVSTTASVAGTVVSTTADVAKAGVDAALPSKK
jgi:hypothetical protein